MKRSRRGSWLFPAVVCAAIFAGVLEADPVRAQEADPSERRALPRVDKEAFRTLRDEQIKPQVVVIRFHDGVENILEHPVLTQAGVRKILWRSNIIPQMIRVRIPPGRMQETINILLDSPDVEYAEPEYKDRRAVSPNDSEFGDQWSFGNSTSAPVAWDAWTGSPSFKIGVVDDGVAVNHPDLAANIWVNPNESAGDANGDGCPGICNVDDDGDGSIDEDRAGLLPGQAGYDTTFVGDDDENGFIDDIRGADTCDFVGGADPSDVMVCSGSTSSVCTTNSHCPTGETCRTNWHGTHVAGTIAAVGNNSLNVAGMNWRASIIAVRYLDCPGAVGSNTNGSQTAALEYVLMKGARISNHSWGGAGSSQAMQDLIQKGREDYGHVFVAAAGNNGTNNDTTGFFPASYGDSSIVSVANYECSPSPDFCVDEVLAGSSNFGAVTVDIAAPGTDILSTVGPTGTGEKNGTSMAAPHVTGALGLLLSRYPYIRWNWAINRLFSHVEPDEDVEGMVATNGKLELKYWMGRYVNLFCSSSGDGFPNDPYCSLAEGINGVNSFGSVVIKGGGGSSFTGSITRPMILDAEGGAAIIGAP